MSDLSKEIVKELGLAGPDGLSLSELFDRLHILQKDGEYLEFFYANMRKLKLGMMFHGKHPDEIKPLSCSQLLNNNDYRFTVSDDQRELAVMGSFYKSLSFSEGTFLILSLIAKYKSLGITQVELAKASGQDAKTVFHHLKILGNAKVIVKYPIIHDGVRSQDSSQKTAATRQRAKRVVSVADAVADAGFFLSFSFLFISFSFHFSFLFIFIFLFFSFSFFFFFLKFLKSIITLASLELLLRSSYCFVRVITNNRIKLHCVFTWILQIRILHIRNMCN